MAVDIPGGATYTVYITTLHCINTNICIVWYCYYNIFIQWKCCMQATTYYIISCRCWSYYWLREYAWELRGGWNPQKPVKLFFSFCRIWARRFFLQRLPWSLDGVLFVLTSNKLTKRTFFTKYLYLTLWIIIYTSFKVYPRP